MFPAAQQQQRCCQQLAQSQRRSTCSAEERTRRDSQRPGFWGRPLSRRRRGIGTQWLQV
ncbi:hypothetical protein LL970_18990 [Xanthomonas dyei pv. eucalypti]|nr:hypothetical protein [Xanthomonas dyei pv. eucalypti]